MQTTSAHADSRSCSPLSAASVSTPCGQSSCTTRRVRKRSRHPSAVQSDAQLLSIMDTYASSPDVSAQFAAGQSGAPSAKSRRMSQPRQDSSKSWNPSSIALSHGGSDGCMACAVS